MTDKAIRCYTTLVLLLVSIAATLAQQEETCYADDKNPYIYYDAKTAYELVHGKKQIPPVPSCTPVQVWLVTRHGTRYPKASDITRLKKLNELRNEIINNHEQRKSGELCNKDLQNLKAWSFNWTEEEGYNLAPQGYEDLFLLAERVKADFPEALNLPYSEDRFKFRHTDTERTQESCKAFIKGMFGNVSANVYVPPPIPNDPMLHQYNNCSTWEEAKVTLEKEMHLFDESSLMKDLMYNVSRRLGFLNNLPKENVTSIYDMCRFSKALNLTGVSPWCAALTAKELQILEYSRDLYYYYTTGYGSDINMKLGCPLVRDMIERFSKLEETTQGQPSGIFYFTHEKQISMLSSRLGFNRDLKPPTHDNYNEMEKRKFRSSFILPFASNIMAVFYKCISGEENQIMFYQNEKVVNYEECNVGLCSWKYIKAKFADIVKPENCNTDFCTINKNEATRFHQVYWLITLIILVLFN